MGINICTTHFSPFFMAKLGDKGQKCYSSSVSFADEWKFECFFPILEDESLFAQSEDLAGLKKNRTVCVYVSQVQTFFTSFLSGRFKGCPEEQGAPSQFACFNRWKSSNFPPEFLLQKKNLRMQIIQYNFYRFANTASYLLGIRSHFGPDYGVLTTSYFFVGTVETEGLLFLLCCTCC